MEILELFSGYGSWSKPFVDNVNKVYTLDIDKKFNPTFCVDILKWDYKKLDIKPDVIFASPDCTYFSISRARWGYPPDKIEYTKKLWYKTFEIIDYFSPKYYLIENPVGKARQFFKNFNRTDYCGYGYNIDGIYIKKPTDLWTNIPMEFKKCGHNHKHYHNMTNIIRSKSKRGIIPDGLTYYIKDIIYRNIN